VSEELNELSVRVDELIDKVTVEESLYRELRALSEAQLAELDRDDSPELAAFTEKKNALLARIETLDSETHAIYDQCKPVLEHLSDDQQFRLQVARLRASEALREAVATEQNGRKKVQVRLKEIENEMTAVRRAREVASKYRPELAGEDEPRFLDEKR